MINIDLNTAMKSRSKRLSNSFRSCDFLGRDVKLTFEGREKYSSPFSQILSVMVIVSVGLVYTPIKLAEFASKTDLQIT